MREIVAVLKDLTVAVKSRAEDIKIGFSESRTAKSFLGLYSAPNPPAPDQTPRQVRLDARCNCS